MLMKRQSVGPILEPSFGYADPSGGPHRPSVSEAFAAWFDSIDFVRKRGRFATAVCAAFHLATLGSLVTFVATYLSLGTILFFVGGAVFVVTTYNTVWYHRYCSHRAFDFRNTGWTRLFLWTNPLFFREEGYLLAHRQHHALSDRAGDPYGPHLGRLGSYLAIEWMQSYDTSMTEEKYASTRRSLRHLALSFNDYEGFRRQGSFEKLSAFWIRTAAAQILWAAPIFLLGGVPYLVAWFSTIFVVMAAMRNFNYDGHANAGRRRESIVPGESHARNQIFYGYFGAEWHLNHHRFPRSASNGFAFGQVDAAFWIIRGLHWMGIVANYRDERAEARRLYGEPSFPGSARRKSKRKLAGANHV
jgi:fatty-acid desaturase